MCVCVCLFSPCEGTSGRLNFWRDVRLHSSSPMSVSVWWVGRYRSTEEGKSVPCHRHPRHAPADLGDWGLGVSSSSRRMLREAFHQYIRSDAVSRDAETPAGWNDGRGADDVCDNAKKCGGGCGGSPPSPPLTYNARMLWATTTWKRRVWLLTHPILFCYMPSAIPLLVALSFRVFNQGQRCWRGCLLAGPA